MVFQLITFFMLVINFKEASLDQSLQLPVLGSARPVDTKGEEDLLVLNIDSEGRLKVYGQHARRAELHRGRSAAGRDPDEGEEQGVQAGRRVGARRSSFGPTRRRRSSCSTTSSRSARSTIIASSPSRP